MEKKLQNSGNDCPGNTCPKNPVIRLTKEFSFEMAHVLNGYDGPCRNIHGHSYKLFITVKGSPCNDIRNPKYGMVIDFGVLKEIVNSLIVNRYDHALIIRETPENHTLLKELKAHFPKIEIVNYQPTCENMIAYFAAEIQKELPQHIELHHLKLHETATSFAEWYREDNL